MGLAFHRTLQRLRNVSEALAETHLSGPRAGLFSASCANVSSRCPVDQEMLAVSCLTGTRTLAGWASVDYLRTPESHLPSQEGEVAPPSCPLLWVLAVSFLFIPLPL